MTIFDPYAKNQPSQPGLNTGSVPDISTLPGQAAPAAAAAPRYRSGLLSALASFLGWISFLMAAAMGALSALLVGLCGSGLADRTECLAEPIDLWLTPVLVLIFGSILAGISGAQVKKRRNVGAFVIAVIGFLILAAAANRFAQVIGLPYL